MKDLILKLVRTRKVFTAPLDQSQIQKPIWRTNLYLLLDFSNVCCYLAIFDGHREFFIEQLLIKFWRELLKMVEIINSLEDLCRLCAGKIDVLMGLNIFASDHRQIFKKICVCLPIQISVDDSFPKMVCVECAFKLDLMFDFREKSILTAHLFSDMMTVNNPNGVVNVNQNIPIGGEGVQPEPDFNNDFLPCKLDSVKYNNSLQSDENILSDNIQLEETTDLMPSKSKIKQRIFIKKMDDLQCGVGTEGQSFVKDDPKFESTSTQSSSLPDKNLSAEINSIISENENVQSISHSPSLDWFFCNTCNRAFEDKDTFESHNQEHLTSEKPDFECDVGDGLKTHPTQNLPNKKKKTKQKKTGKMKGGDKKNESKVCLECGKQYQTNYKLQEHMRKHTGEKPFLCSYQDCKKAFRSKIGLAQHEANHSGQFEFSCSTCGKGFQCKSYLVVHQRVHSDLKLFVCKQCSRRFKTKQSLLDHMNRHLGVKPFLCDICGRGFITKGLCKSHQKVHSGTDNRQYPCHVCRKLFVSKSYLNTHFRIHTGEKPFMCEVCGKGFLTRVDLRIHSTMHTGEKSFVCEMCGKAFARRDALRCHRRSHTGERPYKCEFCGQSFTQFSPMAIHKRLHTGERPYECDVCNKTFVSRSSMIAHRKKHHANTNDGITPLSNPPNSPRITDPHVISDSRFQVVAVEVQQEELNGREDQQQQQQPQQQPSEQLVMIENSPQLLLALSKRHSVVNEQQPPDIISLNKLKDEEAAICVE